MYEAVRKMYHMEWTEAPDGDWIKSTMSPSALNAVMGAVRLLVAGEPQISIPSDSNSLVSKMAGEKLEKASRALLHQAGKVLSRKVHYEIVLSAMLFGEVAVAISCTDDLLKYKAGDAAHQARLKHIARTTPYLFQTWNPMTVYPQFDNFGLRYVVRKFQTTWGEVLDAWGDKAKAMYPFQERDYIVTMWDYYDWHERCVWVQENSEALFKEPHGLPFLPVVCGLADGSFMFDKPEQQRMPMLYGPWKSGLWKRENLSLTMIYSLIYAVGSTALMQYKTKEPGKALTIDRTIPGGVVTILPDESLSPLMEKVVDPTQWQGLETAQRLNENSTIPRQALGAAADSGSMPFSSLSLLSQSGRLPLTAAMNVTGSVLAELVRMAWEWHKINGKTGTFYDAKAMYVIEKSDIPDGLMVNCQIAPDVPTDKLQMANVAGILKSQELASIKWVQENVLGIGQPDSMAKEIASERWLKTLVDNKLAELTALSQAKTQMEIQQAMAQSQSAAQPPSMPDGSATPPAPTPPVMGMGGGAQVPPMSLTEATTNDQQVGPGNPMMSAGPPRNQLG